MQRTAERRTLKFLVTQTTSPAAPRALIYSCDSFSVRPKVYVTLASPFHSSGGD